MIAWKQIWREKKKNRKKNKQEIKNPSQIIKNQF